ncbi:hypothetical protein CBS147343_8264 [Aspergillus niger]|nr:hypothetical protein CBS147322_5012 [Aspergillus niger]KAI2983717.1 hypothetical protein CBS147344_7585 [Aspergillus niger]KAI3063738.1 hypothetical protein CBS147343_8264 [Aspergillus niger]
MSIEIQNVLPTCLAAKPLLPSKSRDQSMDIKPTIGYHPVLQGGEDTTTPNSWVQYRHPTNSGALRNLKKDNNTVRLRPLITITNPLLRNGRLRKLSTNDYLVLAGTFHGVHAITRSITPKLPLAPAAALATTPTTATTPSPSNVVSPSATSSTPTSSTASYSYPNPGVPATGLECLETDKFRLTCFQTLTGTKFLLFTDPLMANIEVVMKKIYELYADFVMKNPFYQLEMPVRCEAFDRNLQGWLRGRT